MSAANKKKAKKKVDEAAIIIKRTIEMRGIHLRIIKRTYSNFNFNYKKY